MSADCAGGLYASAAPAASSDFRRRWPRWRVWRRLRRIWRRPRLWRRWRLLRRVLWRRRIGRRWVGFDHHHDIDLGRGRWLERWDQWRFQWRVERCRDRYRHRQFHDLVFGPDQFVHWPGVDLDVDRSGFFEHGSGVVLGQCFVLHGCSVHQHGYGFELVGQCQHIDRLGDIVRVVVVVFVVQLLIVVVLFVILVGW